MNKKMLIISATLLINSLIISGCETNAEPLNAKQDSDFHQNLSSVATTSMAKLTVDGTKNCSGILISSEWIISSARCLSGSRNVEAQMGGDDLSTQVRVTASYYIIHENYNSYDASFNLSLVKLSAPVVLNDFIQPTTTITKNDLINISGELDIVKFLDWIAANSGIMNSSENSGEIVSNPDLPSEQAANTSMAYLTTNEKLNCTGVLINPEWVLTTAKCLDGVRQVEVLLGATDVSKNEHTQVKIIARQYIIHENYNSFDESNNIGLVRLSTPATLNEAISVTDYSKAGALIHIDSSNYLDWIQANTGY